MVGDIPGGGIGAPIQAPGAKDVCAVQAHISEANAVLLRKLKEDKVSRWLMKHAVEEARAGRLAPPTSIGAGQIPSEVLLHPRFAVSKTKEDGSLKHRAVDHLSWSAFGEKKNGSINGTTRPSETLSHDTLDALHRALIQLRELTGLAPHIFKADIDAAFRRIPVKPDQRWACGVAWKAGEQVCAR